MNTQTNVTRKGLSVKDLVTTGIFTTLLFVFTMVGGVFFATNPVLTFYMPAGSALLCGPIYLLMVAKVQKRWSLTILGVLIGIVWFVTGMHWAFALGYMIMGIVADLVAGAGQYKSKKINILSYILFSLGGTGSYLVFFADPEGWAQTMLGNGTEQGYIDTMQATANTGILIAMFVAVLVTDAPKKLVIPLAVMLRYIPTIQEDWHFIKDAMRMRDVSPTPAGFFKNPGMTIECIYVPLMMAASKAADELSIASVTRGIENPNPRTCLVQIQCRVADWVAMGIAVAFFVFELCVRGGVIG